jgi:hypothetical protein
LRHSRRFAEGTSAAVATDAVEVALYVFCQVRLAKPSPSTFVLSGSAATERAWCCACGREVTGHRTVSAGVGGCRVPAREEMTKPAHRMWTALLRAQLLSKLTHCCAIDADVKVPRAREWLAGI